MHTIKYLTTDGQSFKNIHLSDKEFELAQEFAKQADQDVAEWLLGEIPETKEIQLKDLDPKPSKARYDRGDIHAISDFSHPEFAHAEVSVTIDGKYFKAEGNARRHPTDKPNPHTGILLAYGRAFENLSRRILREANGLVKHNDDMYARKHGTFYDDDVDSAITIDVIPRSVKTKKVSKKKK